MASRTERSATNAGDIGNCTLVETVYCKHTAHSPYRLATVGHNFLEHGWKRMWRDDVKHLKDEAYGVLKCLKREPLPDNVYHFKVQ